MNIRVTGVSRQLSPSKELNLSDATSIASDGLERLVITTEDGKRYELFPGAFEDIYVDYNHLLHTDMDDPYRRAHIRDRALYREVVHDTRF